MCQESGKGTVEKILNENLPSSQGRIGNIFVAGNAFPETPVSTDGAKS